MATHPSDPGTKAGMEVRLSGAIQWTLGIQETVSRVRAETAPDLLPWTPPQACTGSDF